MDKISTRKRPRILGALECPIVCHRQAHASLLRRVTRAGPGQDRTSFSAAMVINDGGQIVGRSDAGHDAGNASPGSMRVETPMDVAERDFVSGASTKFKGKAKATRTPGIQPQTTRPTKRQAELFRVDFLSITARSPRHRQ